MYFKMKTKSENKGSDWLTVNDYKHINDVKYWMKKVLLNSIQIQKIIE